MEPSLPEMVRYIETNFGYLNNAPHLLAHAKAVLEEYPEGNAAIHETIVEDGDTDESRNVFVRIPVQNMGAVRLLYRLVQGAQNAVGPRRPGGAEAS